MNYLTLILILCSFQVVFAKTEKLEVSSTLSLEIPFETKEKATLPSLQTQVLQLKSGNQKFEMMVVHSAPPALGNIHTVNRYWKNARKQTASVDRNEKDFGCQRVTSRTFRCDRTTGQGGKFYSESLFWNAKNDLALIRVSSNTSFMEAQNVTQKIKINANSRLPASRTK